MKKIFFLSLLFICNLGLAQDSTQSGWETVKTFQGSGIKNTERFTVNSSEWKIYYFSKESNVGMEGAGHIFQAFLLAPGQELWQGEIVANEANKKTIKGETYIYKSGTFYFKSNSANGDWEIRIMVPKK